MALRGGEWCPASQLKSYGEIMIYKNIVEGFIEEGIELDNIEKIGYIIKRTKTKSIEEWNTVVEYLKKYTEKTQEYHNDWTFERSLDIYYWYLKKFENMNISLFPKEDMYYIIQNYESQMYFAERKIREEAFKMVLEELSQDKYLGNFMG